MTIDLDVSQVQWRRITSKEEYQEILSSRDEDCADGTDYQGPGHYACTYERRPCPRGCGTDSYLVVMTAEERLEKLKEVRRELEEEVQETFAFTVKARKIPRTTTEEN